MANRVIVVDDDKEVQEIVTFALRRNGFEVAVAGNGQQLQDMLTAQTPDLIILDVMMPKMNGMEVCRRVKKELALNDIFIVLLTAKGQELDRQKGQEVGADLYMTKPFDPEALLAKAREVLGLAS